MAILDGTQGGVARQPHWYALHCRSQYERKVRDQLQTAAVESYLPLYPERTRWSDRIKTVERTLFPGYCFAWFNTDERRRVLSIPGVVRILGIGFDMAAIPDDQVERIRQMVDSGLPIFPMGPLTAGTRVRVEDGPLAGVEGVVLRLHGAWRVVVSVPLLGRSVAAELDTDRLSVLDPPLRIAA